MNAVGTLPQYDRQNAWLELLGPQPEPNVAAGAIEADHVVIGAGYGGLAVARRLAELEPDSQIVVVEAGELGNNAAGRCSGFTIDHAHNLRSKGFAEDAANAIAQIALNRAGLDWLGEIVASNNIDCDWRRNGKVHAAASDKGRATLDGFAASLDAVNEEYRLYDAAECAARFGTSFYRYGLHAPHSATAQPAALVIGLATTLPHNVTVYSASPVTSVDYGPPHRLRTPAATVSTRSLILAANGFGEFFGFYRNRLLPLITWGSMTRELTDAECDELGGDDDYGIIPAHPAGTTVRRLANRRILIRNQYTFSRRSDPTTGRAQVRKVHQASFRNRYPMLADVDFEYTWGGALSLSRNGAGVCGPVADGVWATMVYQGVGMAKGTISGKLLAEWIHSGQPDPQISLLTNDTTPSRNYPDPFNRWGVRGNARWRRWQAGIEE